MDGGDGVQARRRTAWLWESCIGAAIFVCDGNLGISAVVTRLRGRRDSTSAGCCIGCVVERWWCRRNHTGESETGGDEEAPVLRRPSCRSA